MLGFLFVAGCGGGEEDPVLVPATMAPTTVPLTTIAMTTTTTTPAYTPTTTTAAYTPTTTTAAYTPTTTTAASPTTTEPVMTGPTSVVVEVGDSLSKIAKRYDTTTEVLAAINGICNVNQIYVGQTILLAVDDVGTDDDGSDAEPMTVTVLVEVGDSLSEIAKRYNTTVDDLMVANDIAEPNLLFVGQELVVSGIVPVVPDVEPPVC